MQVVYVGTDTSREFVRHVNEVPMDREKELLILLNIGRTPNLKDRRWVWYVLDAATAKPVLTEPLHKKLMLRVAVLDSEGQPLRQVDVPVNNTRDALFSGAPQQNETRGHRPGLGQVKETRDALFSGAPSKWMKDVVRTDEDWMISKSRRNRPPTFEIAPYIYVSQNDIVGGADYGEALEFDYTADFTWDEIKKITEIRCSIVIGSPSNK
jgi:hypothetical protein